MDSTGGGHLTADVEGLTIYFASGGTRYLIASSQGSNSFVVYRREGNNAYVGTFAIGASNGIDPVEQTDGIDVTSRPASPLWPKGLFIAQLGGQQRARGVAHLQAQAPVRPRGRLLIRDRKIVPRIARLVIGEIPVERFADGDA